MSRQSKGPRLYLRRNLVKSGRPVADVWVIRDGQKEVSTGFPPSDIGAAEQVLAAYIAEKWTPPAAGNGPGDPASIYVAEVLAHYLKKKLATAPDPSALKARVAALNEWWGESTLADVRESTCEDYVAHRMTQPIKQAKDPATARRVTAQGARRELEDLSSAIGKWEREYPLNRRPKVTLPEKPESPRDALTRHQAACLLKAAMGYRKVGECFGPWAPGQSPRHVWKRRQASTVANRLHLRRFALIGFYTGSRPGVIPKVLWHESPVQAWADTRTGTIFRRGRDERDHRTKRRPLVRMPNRLIAHMRRWERMDGESGTDERPAPSTVLHHGGAPILRLRRGFASIVADAGLPPEVTPHWMRHTCATWLMEADEKTWDAANYVGMTPTTLEKHYGHHRPGHQSSARKALGGRR